MGAVLQEKISSLAANQSLEKPMTKKISSTNHDITPLSPAVVAELAKKLSPEEFRVTQSSGTERPFCGNLLDNKKEGLYVCVVCGLPLFSSEHKFNSGTGWPSFFREFDSEHVSRKSDRSHGMIRTEVNCVRCRSHLGHVFEDGPPPTGERHCLNSASLKFIEKSEPLPVESRPIGVANPKADAAKTEVAYFAGGCFWGLEHYFQLGPGVIDASSGYMQGAVKNPAYREVCSGDTGHAETVKVVYDPSKISFQRLLEAFFKMHDPTQLNYQGPDHGTQYRSGIWTVNEDQKAEAVAYVRELESKKVFGTRKIVTQIESAEVFYPAEDYHQDYISKSGRSCHVSNPW